MAEWQESGAKLPDSRRYAQTRKNNKNSDSPRGHVAMNLPVYRKKNQVHQRNQPERPKYCPQHNSPAKRMTPGHAFAFMRYPRFLTVSIKVGPSFFRNRAINTSTVFESRSKSWL